MPIGFVTAKINRRKNRICNHPLIVIGIILLEFFGAQKRVSQVNKQKGGNHNAQNSFEMHGLTPYCNFSQPRTYASESRKKTIVNATKIRSNMISPSSFDCRSFFLEPFMQPIAQPLAQIKQVFAPLGFLAYFLTMFFALCFRQPVEQAVEKCAQPVRPAFDC
jgi:hypothetical protein